MTHNILQPMTSVSQQYPSYGPQWQGYDLHQCGYGASQMFPQQQFLRRGLSSAGGPTEPPGLPRNNPVNQPTSSSSTSTPGPPSGAPDRLPISFQMKQFLPPAEQWKTAVTRIVDLLPIPDISYHDYDADDESDDSLDFGGAEGEPPVSQKQTEFSLKQFAKRIRQANHSAYNNWKTVWVAGFLEKKRCSIIWGQNQLKQHRNRPQVLLSAVADCFQTGGSGLVLDNINNAESICRHRVEMFLQKWASEIPKVRK